MIIQRLLIINFHVERTLINDGNKTILSTLINVWLFSKLNAKY